MNLTLALTNYNRTDMLIKAFAQVAADERINEILIVDDKSQPHVWEYLEVKTYGNPKIKLHRNKTNLGVYKNKKRAMELAANDWVLLFDSDNILAPDYLDRFFELELDPDFSYLPDFAKPDLDYRAYSGTTVTRKNVAGLIPQGRFDALINTMNGVYHKATYLGVWDDKIEPISSDSIYLNYLLLNAGKSLHIVKGMEYIHTIHNGSHYQQNCHLSNQIHAGIMKKIKALR